MREQHVLDIAGRQRFTAPVDEFPLSSAQPNLAGGIDAANIAGSEPGAVKRLGIGGVRPQQAADDIGALDADFACCTFWPRVALGA